MNGLIQKSGYIKPGSGGGHYAEYIATRDGVEMIEPAASGYLEYMAERPRSHGLFSVDGPADLEKTMEEINAHAGPVWTFVYSLKRMVHGWVMRTAKAGAHCCWPIRQNWQRR